jgi:hypothetical protein
MSGAVVARTLAVVVCASGVAAALLAYRSERRVAEIKQLALVAIGQDRDLPGGQRRARRARREALRLAKGARLLNPDSDIDVQRALFLEPARRRSEAVMREATRREPENAFLWLSLSKRREGDDDLSGARRAYARARALDPRLPPP